MNPIDNTNTAIASGHATNTRGNHELDRADGSTCSTAGAAPSVAVRP